MFNFLETELFQLLEVDRRRLMDREKWKFGGLLLLMMKRNASTEASYAFLTNRSVQFHVLRPCVLKFVVPTLNIHEISLCWLLLCFLIQ